MNEGLFIIEIRSGRVLEQDSGRPERRNQCAYPFIGRDAMVVKAANAVTLWRSANKRRCASGLVVRYSWRCTFSVAHYHGQRAVHRFGASAGYVALSKFLQNSIIQKALKLEARLIEAIIPSDCETLSAPTADSLIVISHVGQQVMKIRLQGYWYEKLRCLKGSS